MAIIPADEKVFMVDKRTNTTYGGSQALQDMQQWYTMQDVADSVQPYTVFTALITQHGGDDIQNINIGAAGSISPNLVIGVTYTITLNDGGIDFTNVGAPNNDPGTSFIATGETPGNQPSGTGADLTFNNGAPVATVLENTIGNIWFSYNSDSAAAINSNGLFNPYKTMSIVALNTEITGPDATLYSVKTISDSLILVEWYIPSSDALGTPPLDTPIEIRVYN
jgi:hypothetical protein